MFANNISAFAAVQALDVTAVRFGVHDNSERAVIELSSPVEFRAFVMADPNRIIIDMKSFHWKTGNVAHPTGSLVSDVRYGPLGNGRGRLVFQTTQPVLVKSAFLIPKSKGQPDRLVVDFSATSAATLNDVGSQILGQLPTQSPVAPVAPVKNIQGTKVVKTKKSALTKPVEDVYKPRAKQSLIIIDPGHGGQDPGALGANGMFEKTIVLAVGLELKKQLEASGYRVKMTRDRDVFIQLRERVVFARKHKGDLFISLHADSIRDSKVTGASVYTLSDKASDIETEKLADRENKSDLIAGIDLSHQENDVAGILIDLAARDTMNQSRYLANTVVMNFDRNGVTTIDGAQRSAGFAVLKAMDIPSILVEMGYLTNHAEVSRLSTPAYRQRVAQALKGSVDLYFQKVSENFSK
ncbi:MAG: N-acetylmuramoyl-L-alanine amidase [Pseudomonadota bacterium]